MITKLSPTNSSTHIYFCISFRIELICGKATELWQLHGGQNTVQNHFTKQTTLIMFFPGLQSAAVTGKGQGLRCSLGCLLSPPFRIERICGKATELWQLHGGQNDSSAKSRHKEDSVNYVLPWTAKCCHYREGTGTAM